MNCNNCYYLDGKIKDIAYTSNMMNLNESSAPLPSPFPVGDAVIVVVSSTATGRIACYHQQPRMWKRKNDAHDAQSKKKQKKDWIYITGSILLL